TTIFGSSNPRPEVNVTMDLYRGILGRIPDSAGFNYWLGRVRAAQCQGPGAVTAEVNGLSQQFLNSQEYANTWSGRSSSQRVPMLMGDLYNALMRRGPDLAGYQFYVGQINAGGKSIDQVRADFVQSPEFQARVSAIVSAQCLP
ncbi:MAG TPA: DUF4214 domain-containing protein, partial [Bryobacteraceae bacterium]|nr:DUF4214 domain-containing protein [Bryobacteraceae bacterium]